MGRIGQDRITVKNQVNVIIETKSIRRMGIALAALFILVILTWLSHHTLRDHSAVRVIATLP